MELHLSKPIRQQSRLLDISVTALTVIAIAKIIGMHEVRADGPSHLTARSIDITDNNGTIRAHIGVSSSGQTELSLNGPDGKVRSKLLISQSDTLFELTDASDQAYGIRLYPSRHVATVSLSDSGERSLITQTLTREGAGITLSAQNNHRRLLTQSFDTLLLEAESLKNLPNKQSPKPPR